MEVGLRRAPVRARPAPKAGSARRGRREAVVGLLALAAVALAAWRLLAGLAAAPAVSPGEASFAVRAFAINRFGYGAAQLPWYDGGLAALQVAGYETVSGALRRSASAVVAAREAAVVATVLAAAALTLAARRLRLSEPATVAVPLLFGLAPAAVLLHRTAEPAQLGVLWACVALALAGGEAGRTGAAVGAVCYLVAAAASSPVVLVALVPLFTALLWSGDIGRLRRGWRWLVAGTGALAWAGLVVLAARGDLPGGGGAAPPPLTALDVALAAAALLAAATGLWIRWLRPLALALLAVAAAAAVAPDSRGPLLAVALPLAAVVLPAAGDAAVTVLSARLRAAGPTRPPVRAPAVAGGVLAVLAALAWVPASAGLRGTPGAPGTPAADRQAVDQACAWVLANLPSRPKLAVDDMVWASLVEAGYPADQLAAAGGLGPDRPAWPGGWADSRYVIGRDRAVFAGSEDTVRRARESSTPVAAFGAGEDRVEVRRVTGRTERAGPVGSPAERAETGRALAANPRLRLEPPAAALLLAGAVDTRVTAVLAAITGQHGLAIADFPVVPGENADQPRRLIAVTAIDDVPVRAGGTPVTLLEQWLRAQQPPYRPAGTEVSPSGVLVVRYDALGGGELLPP